MSGANPVEGMELFEVYEANGNLLYISSTPISGLGPGDVVVRRPWATAAEPVVVRRA